MEKKNYEQSKKLDNVCYDIRGPVMDEAMRAAQIYSSSTSAIPPPSASMRRTRSFST